MKNGHLSTGTSDTQNKSGLSPPSFSCSIRINFFFAEASLLTNPRNDHVTIPSFLFPLKELGNTPLPNLNIPLPQSPPSHTHTKPKTRKHPHVISRLASLSVAPLWYISLSSRATLLSSNHTAKILRSHCRKDYHVPKTINCPRRADNYTRRSRLPRTLIRTDGRLSPMHHCSRY